MNQLEERKKQIDEEIKIFQIKTVFNIHDCNFNDKESIMVPKIFIQEALLQGYNRISDEFQFEINAKYLIDYKNIFNGIYTIQFYITKINFLKDFSSNNQKNFNLNYTLTDYKNYQSSNSFEEYTSQLDHILYNKNKVNYYLIFNLYVNYFDITENYYKDKLKVNMNQISWTCKNYQCYGKCSDIAVIMKKN